MPSQTVPKFEPRGESNELVVLLHSYMSSPVGLRHLRDVVVSVFPNADILVPELPVSRFSMADPVAITCDALGEIDRCWNDRKARGEGIGYQKVILAGHSIGGLLARKLYIYACGENSDAPFEPGVDKNPREWGPFIDRIILLAGMNRGWSISHHMSLLHAIVWSIGTVMGNFLTLLYGRPPVIFTIRRGGSFITQLRIQWLSMLRHRKGLETAMTIQLLGSVDDLVAPEDNIDLLSGRDFIYLDVPHSGHTSVVIMDDTAAGRERRAVFARALTGSREELVEMSEAPADLAPQPPREEVTDVIFVIHGIRDLGFWTYKIARRIKAAGRKLGRIFETETSTYGYFAMLPFLLPSQRRAKVEWLMDQYTENLALYPNADFSFVGHSNGTYLLARALEDYPACHFKHVVFAGSVVRRDYNWSEMIRSGRVKKVLNFVATNDWVVAFFPKALQALRWQDLGSAGHDGFASTDRAQSVRQIEYVRGAHSAALSEDNWDSIANFILHGEPDVLPTALIAKRRRPLIVGLGKVALVVWIAIIAALVLGVIVIGSSDLAEWQKTLSLVLYGWVIWVIVTKL